ARTRRALVAEFSYKDSPAFSEARAISKMVQELFLKGEVDRVDVLFTNFINTLVQKPQLRPFLPIGEVKKFDGGVEGKKGPGAETQQPAGDGKGNGAGAEPAATTFKAEGGIEYKFEPDPGQVFAALLPHYLNFQIFQILL